MQGWIDSLIRGWGQDPASWPWTQLVYLAFMGLFAFIVINFAAITAGIFSWAERRVAARMQSRVGPSRVGPGGFLQWIADAVKLLTKEDLVPAEADNFLFRIAPYFMMVGFACVFVALPFSHRLVIADMNIGIFFILAVTALIVVGIIMSGWSSNSKWSLFGAIRSAAQIISYELLSLAIFAGKTLFWVFVVMWLRWTLPRIRVDQMMNMCWKYLVPVSFAAVIFVAGWMLVVRAAPAVGTVTHWIMFLAAGVLPAAFFINRVARNIHDTGDKFDFTSNW